jgi:hypothetical protein
MWHSFVQHNISQNCIFDAKPSRNNGICAKVKSTPRSKRLYDQNAVKEMLASDRTHVRDTGMLFAAPPKSHTTWSSAYVVMVENGNGDVMIIYVGGYADRRHEETHDILNEYHTPLPSWCDGPVWCTRISKGGPDVCITQYIHHKTNEPFVKFVLM